MLNVLDPSSRLVLRGDAKTGAIAGIRTDGFQFVVQSYDPAKPRASGYRLPRGDAANTFGAVPTWSWPTWEVPRSYAELKPQFEAMRRTFGATPDRPASVTSINPRPSTKIRSATGP